MSRTRVLLAALFTAVLFSFIMPSAEAQSGSWLWGRANTGAGIDAYAVTTDPSGNVYGGGINYGGGFSTPLPATFGTITVPNSPVAGTAGGLGDIQAIWVKYSPSGTALWAAGTMNADAWLYNLATDASGNLIVFGSFDSPTLTLGSTVLTNAYGASGDNQYFLAKYSPTGTLLWAICDGNSCNTYHYFLGSVCILTTGGVTTDASGNVYITSSFQKPSMTIGTTTLTNSDPSGTTSDIFLAKYNSSGVLQWATKAGGNSDDFAYSVAIGSGGKIYVTGPFWSSSASFGSSTISNPYGTGGYGGGIGTGGTPLAYIAEFSSAGAANWAQAAGGSIGSYGMGVVTDASGNAYMTGGFGDASISFGGTSLTRTYPAAVPELALFLVQYSPSHSVTWSKTIGSATSGVWGFAIALAACGEVWVSGNYDQDADVDGHTLARVPGSDPVFIAGYNLSGGVIGYSGLGSGGDDQNGIACDPGGNVYICSDYGSFGGLFTVGPDVLPADSANEMFYIGKYANIAVAGDTTFKRTDTAVCNASSLLLSAPAGYNYTWDNATTLQTRNVSASGVYWVVCATSCSLPTIVDTFHVVISPADTTHSFRDTAVCIVGSSMILQGDPGFTSYLWSTGSSASSIAVSSAGLYWVHESNGCAVKLDTFNITLSPAPQVNLGNDTTLCSGNGLTLTCPEPPDVSYLWSTGSTASSISVTGSGDYSLTVTRGGCSAKDDINVLFQAAPQPFFLGPDTTICDEPEFIIQSKDSATVWSNGKRGPHITVTFPGQYIATIANNCGETTDTINVSFEHCLILVPNAFTPNNDGKNDVFKLVGLSLEHYYDFSLSCFNRFGQRVFYSEDVNAGWDGVYNGTPQDMGTYFYLVKYSLNGKSHMLKGDFELVR